MSERRGLLSRIFGPKETGCCGVQFENLPSEAETRTAAAAVPSEQRQSTSCCGSAKKAAGQDS